MHRIDMRRASARQTGCTEKHAWLAAACVVLGSACAAASDDPIDARASLLTQAGTGSEGAPAATANQAAQKRWHEPVVISAMSGDAREPSLAVNARGDALLGWAQTDRLGVNVASASYAVGAGWRAPVQMPENAGEAREVHVSLDDEGHGLLVWDAQRNPASVAGMSATWSAADGYSTPQELLHFDPSVATTYGPRFASYADRAIALWGYAAGRGVAIQAFRYERGSGWGAPSELQWDPAPTRPVGIVEADVALGGQGLAYTAYVAAGAPWANRSTPEQPVGAAMRLDSADSGSAATPRLAADGGGRALAVWTRHDTGRQLTLASHYVSPTGWTTPVTLQSTPVATDSSTFAEVSQSRAVFSADGRACAALIRPQPQHLDVWTACYRDGRWERPSPIDLRTQGTSRSLQVAADGRGNWVAVWSRASGSEEHIYANRYVSGRGWTGPTRLDADGGNSLSPTLSLDASGNGFAAWTQLRGYAQLLVSRLE